MFAVTFCVAFCNNIIICTLIFQNRRWMGTRERSEESEACWDISTPSTHEGVAIRAVLQLLSKDAVAAALEESSRGNFTTSSSAAGATVYVFASTKQPNSKATQGEKRLQRHQHADGVPGRHRQGGGVRGEETQDGQTLRRQLLHAVRTIVLSNSSGLSRPVWSWRECRDWRFYGLWWML